jgi:hypothetical protein
MTRHRRTTAAHRAAAVVVGALLAPPLVALAVLATAVPAQASTYRYWTYWWGTDTGKPHSGWMFAPQGPAYHGLADRWVLGWRFATSTTSGGAEPRQSADYDTLCPGTSPVVGSVRIALVIDYGTTADAPPGQRPPTTSSVRRECLTIPVPTDPLAPRPTGITVLNAPTKPVVVRSDNGIICALDYYPAHECAPVIADPTVPATGSPAAAVSPTRRAASAPTAGRASAGGGATASAIGASPAAVSPVLAPASPRATPLPSPPATTAGAAPETTLAAVAGPPPAVLAEQQSGSPIGLGIGAVLVGAVAGSAYWTSRRGGRSS